MDKSERSENTLTMYVVGFILSLLLTASAYVAVTQQLFTGGTLIAVIIGLAVLQVLGQLYFFLHLGRETKPRWKLVILGFMLLVLGIVVVGTLWIMQNLNYHMMPNHEVDSYMIEQNKKGF